MDLNDEDLNFIKELVTDKPSIYADEIQRSLAKEHGITVSVSTILNTLHGRLNMLKKTMRTVHPKQDKTERAHYIYQVGAVPTSCLVFTGKLLDQHLLIQYNLIIYTKPPLMLTQTSQACA